MATTSAGRAEAGVGAAGTPGRVTGIVPTQCTMPADLAEFIVGAAQDCLAEHELVKDAATALKRRIEEHAGGLWHALIGQSFGVSITTQTNYMGFFKASRFRAPPLHILAFQTLDEQAWALEHAPEEAKAGDSDEEGESDSEGKE